MIEHAIYTILNGSISTTRIYPVMLPQNAVFPCVSYSVVEDEENETYDGQGTFQSVSVEIDAWSETHAGMLTLADEIKTVIKNYSGVVAGVTIAKATIESAVSVYETETGMFRKTLLVELYRL